MEIAEPAVAVCETVVPHDVEKVVPLVLTTPVCEGNGTPVAVMTASDSASATGHTVVETTTISVVTDPILAGQSVTDAAHDVMEYTEVLKTVLMVQP